MDMLCNAMVYLTRWWSFKVGLDGLGGLDQPIGLCDSVIIPSCSFHISLFPPFEDN